MTRYLAVDTECTGVAFHAGDKPYYVSSCDDEGNLKCWRFPVDEKTRLVLPPEKNLIEIQEYLDAYDRVVFHNAKFDIRSLRSIGLSINDRDIEDTLLASHIHTNNGTHKLKDLALLHLDIPSDDEEGLLKCIARARTLAKKLGWKIAKAERAENEGEPWMKVDAWVPGQLYEHLVRRGEQPPDEAWATCLEAYGTRDAERTMALWLLYKEWLQDRDCTGFECGICENGQVDTGAPTPNGSYYTQSCPYCNGYGHTKWEAYRAQVDVIPALVEIENRGVSLRLKQLSKNIEYYGKKAEAIRLDLGNDVGDVEFNPGSTKQLQRVLFDEKGFAPVRSTKTGYSTDADTLVYLHRTTLDPFLEKLLTYRKCSKTESDLQGYVDKIHHRRLHGSINPIGTDTTRVSFSNPNLQNVSKGEDYEDDWVEEFPMLTEDDYKIREVFGPEPGRIWLDMDYDQLQLRVFAYVSGEKRLIKAFEDGWDAHNFVACQVFKTDTPNKLQRRVAKSINFGFIFGAQEEKITKVSGDPEVWVTVNKLFPNAVDFLAKTSDDVRRTGYVTTGGYRLYIPIDPRRGKVKAYAGVCYKVQGLEGLIVKRAMVYWHKHLKQLCKVYRHPSYAYLSLQVHDELIADFTYLPRNRLLPHASMLKSLMEKAGQDYGVVTPATISIVSESWDKCEEVAL